jgi:hypothetical protein
LAEKFAVESAGIKASSVRLEAIGTMSDLGIDILEEIKEGRRICAIHAI